ncbi:MAG: cofactor-independent phosphoglycerate mutase [Planctomycetota bacterium]
MKYVIVIPDGCADEPQESLGGRTPLEAADTPAMDQVATAGVVGRANHTPLHLTAGSAVANMSLLGYDPVENFTGRAPLEAAAQGIELGDNDWCVRCNLVTIKDQIMRDFTANHISSEEARRLLATAQENLDQWAGQNEDDRRIELIPGVSYRNLMVYRPEAGEAAPFSVETRTTPPHDLTDKAVADNFPRGAGSQFLAEVMSRSMDWFEGHEVNLARKESGKLDATNVWLWGLGQRPKLNSFASVFGKKGAMITAVDLLRGLATLVGWDRIEVPGATGYLDTDYEAKGAYGIKAVADYDIVCIHVEASDEASHEGKVDKKIEALERIDEAIVAPMLEHLQTLDQWRLLVTPDHPTFIRTRTHSHGDVPFTICGSGIEADDYETYSETNASVSTLAFDQGWDLMPHFIGSKR